MLTKKPDPLQHHDDNQHEAKHPHLRSDVSLAGYRRKYAAHLEGDDGDDDLPDQSHLFL